MGSIQLYHNCSGLKPCRRSVTLIQLRLIHSPGCSRLLLWLRPSSTTTLVASTVIPQTFIPSLGLSSEYQTLPFSGFPAVSTRMPEALQTPPSPFSVFTGPAAQAENQSVSIFPSPFLPTTNLLPCPVKSCISGLLISLLTPSLT